MFDILHFTSGCCNSNLFLKRIDFCSPLHSHSKIELSLLDGSNRWNTSPHATKLFSNSPLEEKDSMFSTPLVYTSQVCRLPLASPQPLQNEGCWKTSNISCHYICVMIISLSPTPSAPPPPRAQTDRKQFWPMQTEAMWLLLSSAQGLMTSRNEWRRKHFASTKRTCVFAAWSLGILHCAAQNLSDLNKILR